MKPNTHIPTAPVAVEIEYGFWMPYHVVEFGDYFLYYLFLILYVQELVSAKATTKVSNNDEIIPTIGILLKIPFSVLNLNHWNVKFDII